MGLSHYQTAHPCADYGPKRCYTCRLRPWCILFRTSPPPDPGSMPRRAQARRVQGASITPLQLL